MNRVSRLTPTSWLLINHVAAVLAFFAASLYALHLTASFDDEAQEIAGNADPSEKRAAELRTGPASASGGGGGARGRGSALSGFRSAHC